MVVSLVRRSRGQFAFLGMLVAMSLLAKHIKKTMTDGSTVGEFFWESALHRVGGPAMVSAKCGRLMDRAVLADGQASSGGWRRDHLAQAGRQHESCVIIATTRGISG
jgi:hypothetical protein